MSRVQGTVKWFSSDPSKNFGFVVTPEGDAFIHATQVIGALPQEGNTVELDLEKGPKGLRGRNVRIIRD